MVESDPDHGSDHVAAIERLRLLIEVSGRVGSTLDLYQTGRDFVEVLVPRFADAAALLVLDRLVTDDEAPHPDASPEDAVVRRIAHAPRPELDGAYGAVFPIDEIVIYPPGIPNAICMRTRRTIAVHSMPADEAEQIGEMWNREPAVPLLAGRSILYTPLVARGILLGLAIFSRLPESVPFDEIDVTFAEEVTTRAALCIDNARLYSRAQRTALTLQRTLLPGALQTQPGMQVTNRYLPGSDAAEVGGDWFDVIPLPGGRAGLVVGDVMGHGVRAAAVMGQLRTAARALASVELNPAAMLAKLDEIMQNLDIGYYATCLYAVYDPVVMRCTFARAGHVPPAIVHPDGSVGLLDVPTGTPLGIGGGSFPEVEVRLAHGSVLALCTDGLVESRDRDIDTGLETLLRSLAGVGRTLEEIADAVVAALYHEKDRDDIALLLVRTEALSEDTVVTWDLPPQTSSVRLARRHVRGALGAWGLERLSDNAQLATSELVTNAIRHVGGPVRLRLLRDRALLIEVSDTSETPPELRDSAGVDDGGRGLRLVSSLAARWGTRRSGLGKTVWLELALPE